MAKRTFVYCEKCGKKLIERLPNGLWKFAFGRRKLLLPIGEEQPSFKDNDKEPVVVMLIRGSVKMKCLREDCGHYNILPYFPNSKDFIEK